MNALFALLLLAAEPLDPDEIWANWEAPDPQVSAVEDIFIAPTNVIVTIETANRRVRVEKRTEGVRYTVLTKDGTKTLYDALPFEELLAWEPRLAAMLRTSTATKRASSP